MWSELTPFIGPGAGGGVLLGAIWMVLTGRLIPRGVHDLIVASKQQVIDAKDKEITSLQSALAISNGQRDELLGMAKVTVAAVQAIPAAKDAVS